ncbi:hypothetical protein [Robertmurraya siralis]|uniref:hypothetical protein n=1 Tax=Robertmurraya siralis TaxID=77777 RepID=UPI0010F53EEE|nr:hypothetical protein [Robertmurraya siralis]
MELIINENLNFEDVNEGDIITIANKPYLVKMDHGIGADALLIGLSGKKEDSLVYFDMKSLRNNLTSFENVKHYKSTEYELRLFRK